MRNLFLFLLFIPMFVKGQEIILTGRVVDPDFNEPISGATVSLYLGSLLGEVETKTDNSGRFVFRHDNILPDLDYAIVINKLEYYRLNGTVRLNFGNVPDRLFKMHRIPPDEIIRPEDAAESGPSLLGAPTNNLIFLIDISGSMAEENRLEDLKESMLYLVSLYRPEDMITIITYSTTVKVVLNQARVSGEYDINRIIKELRPSGKSEGVAGLDRAYGLALQNYTRYANNKIIMATDGIFAEDKKSRKLVEDMVTRGYSDGIHLSIFSFGNEAASVSERLTGWSRLGGGNYTHIRSLEEAKDQVYREAKGE